MRGIKNLEKSVVRVIQERKRKLRIGRIKSMKKRMNPTVIHPDHPAV